MLCVAEVLSRPEVYAQGVDNSCWLAPVYVNSVITLSCAMAELAGAGASSPQLFELSH
jgi:hypothetical protein